MISSSPHLSCCRHQQFAAAELLVVDEDARDAFDFDNDHYLRQLVAGHSRTLPSLGLEVYMPDMVRMAPGAFAAR